jgi:hypothetical protein
MIQGSLQLTQVLVRRTKENFVIIMNCPLIVGLASVVGITAGHGLDGTRIEFRWAPYFPRPFTMALVLNHPPVQWMPGLFPRLKRPGGVVDHPPAYIAEVEEIV